MAKRGPKTKLTAQLLKNANQYIAKFTRKLTGKCKFNELPSIEGLAIWLEVSKQTLYVWEKEHEEISDALEMVRKLEEQYLKQYGLNGQYNPTIAKLVLSSNYGYRDREEKVETPPPEDPMSLDNIVERVKAVSEAGDGLAME